MARGSRRRRRGGISLVEVTFAITALGSGGFWFSVARLQTQALESQEGVRRTVAIARDQTELAAVLRWESRAAIAELAPIELGPGIFPGELPLPFPAELAPDGDGALEIRSEGEEADSRVGRRD